MEGVKATFHESKSLDPNPNSSPKAPSEWFEHGDPLARVALCGTAVGRRPPMARGRRVRELLLRPRVLRVLKVRTTCRKRGGDKRYRMGDNKTLTLLL